VTAVIPFLFGLVPAVVASRPNLQSALHEAAGRRRRKRGPYGGRDLLVIVEVGLAVVLVVSAGMFTRFFAELGRVQWGFDPARVVAVELSLKREVGAGGANATLVEEVVAALRQVPGVAGAASGSFIGMDPVWRGEPLEFESCAAPPNAVGAATTPVDADFFATLGMQVRRGRGIETRDTAGAPWVAVISQRHADRCWPGQDPLGRRVRRSRAPGAEWMMVVGVVADAITTKAVEVVQPVYVPVTQVERVPSTVFVRAKGETAGLIGPLRAAVRSVDKHQPQDTVGRLDDRLFHWRSGTPVILGIIGGFGLFALTLAALGVFSVISYMVAERTREFGVRIALGASRADVLRLVAGQAAAIVAIGAIASSVGTLCVTSVTFREMADLATTDYTLWAGVTALLAFVAVAATIVPARRATRIEPMAALRAE
jgi:putative ABC transport system permease protein